MIIELLTNRYPGMRLWLSQRLTAVVMAVYLVALLVFLLFVQPNTYAAWSGFTSHGLFKVSTSLFFISLMMHAWLGVRDVLRDYVFNLTLRAVLQIIVDLLLSAYLIWFAVIAWQL